MKNENAGELNKEVVAVELSARPAIMFMLETTCSFATSPWNAETVVAQLQFPPSIG